MSDYRKFWECTRSWAFDSDTGDAEQSIRVQAASIPDKDSRHYFISVNTGGDDFITINVDQISEFISMVKQAQSAISFTTEQDEKTGIFAS